MTHQVLPQLEALLIPVASLHPDPANARTHGRRNVAALTASLAKFGQRKPIVVQREGMVVRAGNCTLACAISLGWTHIAAVVVDEGDLEATAFAIADNRVAELAGWDDAALGALLEQLAGSGAIDELVSGFTGGEIGRLIGSLDGSTDADAIPELPSEPSTQPGDLWRLGDHRLLCGDAESEADVARLLDGERPWMMVTDPPYGVDYDPAWRTRADAGARRTGRVLNDDRAGWAKSYALFGGDVAYVWHAAVHATTVATDLGGLGFGIRAQLIWNKRRLVLSRGAYHWRHEPCWYAVRNGRSARWAGDRTQSTVWDIAECEDTNTMHGTQKPVECMERPMRNHGAPGDLIYDPFLGSGTSVIAAERSRRRCYGLELDPRYCDVIVSRWEAFTGRKAEREHA